MCERLEKEYKKKFLGSDKEDSQLFKTVSQTSYLENDDNHSKNGEEDDMNQN